ncbi:MAG: hypothetical protein J0L63_05590 [Anaerolineae bacterium]|nr:hypothetical protein [Anaerolineae bacterium]
MTIATASGNERGGEVLVTWHSTANATAAKDANPASFPLTKRQKRQSIPMETPCLRHSRPFPPYSLSATTTTTTTNLVPHRRCRCCKTAQISRKYPPRPVL